MIVTCPACHTEYRLDPNLLGAEGRKVGCADCSHQWFQKHVPVKDIHDVIHEAEIIAVEEPEPIVHAPETPPAPNLEDDFETILRQTAASIAPVPAIPESVIPAHVTKAPAPAVYKPMGMGALQFGVLTFLLCSFVSASALFLAKGPVARLLPATTRLYRALGIAVPAPGEGLRLGGLVAENRVDKTGRVLSVEAQLSNMTDAVMPYPVLRVTLSSAYGAALKAWTLDNKDAKPLAPGEAVPVKSEFKDAPEGGTDIEIKVVEP